MATLANSLSFLFQVSLGGLFAPVAPQRAYEVVLGHLVEVHDALLVLAHVEIDSAGFEADSQVFRLVNLTPQFHPVISSSGLLLSVETAQARGFSVSPELGFPAPRGKSLMDPSVARRKSPSFALPFWLADGDFRIAGDQTQTSDDARSSLPDVIPIRDRLIQSLVCIC